MAKKAQKAPARKGQTAEQRLSELQQSFDPAIQIIDRQDLRQAYDFAGPQGTMYVTETFTTYGLYSGGN